MNAVEEIPAAIEKLAALKSEATKGPWEGWRKYDPLRGTQFGIEAASAEVAKVYTPQDAELIEVLHATIDAQLEVLHLGLRYAAFDRSALILARAIIGATS